MGTKGGQRSGPAIARPAVVEALRADGYTQRRSNPAEWDGSCPHPEHDDSTPSFSYNAQKDTAHCHGCGRSWNGAELATLLDVADAATQPPPSADRRRTFVYAKEGAPVFRKVRVDAADGKRCHWEHATGRGALGTTTWRKGKGDSAPLIYNHDAVRAAAGTDQIVLFCEGEPKADQAMADGFIGSTVGGAKDWRPEHAAQLVGVHLVLLPDNDAPGEAHMMRVATDCLPLAASVSLLRLPGLGPSEDLVDWRRQHSAKALRAEVKRATPITSVADLPPDPHAAGIVVLDIGAGELAAQQFRPREPIVSPIIDRQGLGMLYGRRGILKTQLAVGIATAAATGTPFLRFAVPQPRRVLYIDGELQGWRVQELFDQAIRRLRPGTTLAPGYLRLITPDAQPTLFAPNLADEQAQRLLRPHLDGVDLVVLDNLSALLRGDENEAAAYDTMQAFMLQLRQDGVAVLILHHANKAGDQRGTSKREDLLDTVMRLNRPTGYTPEDGAWATVEFTKSRGFWGADAAPFEVWLEDDGSGRATWHHGERANAQADELRDQLAAGKSMAAAAKAAKVSRSTAYRRLRVVPAERATRGASRRRRKY